jgi:decaprenyl-phosphate phosphoribosyltransferase
MIHLPATGERSRTESTGTYATAPGGDLGGGGGGAPRGGAPWPAQVIGLLQAARPRQWVKNLLVLAAPAAAGVLTHLHGALVASSAVAVFCLASASVYLVNDALDAPSDRRHPAKRNRPVASGLVSAKLAAACGAGGLGLAAASAWLLAGPKLGIVVALYATISITYSLRLKREPVVEMACVCSGFVLRAIAGGVATGVPLSDWFLIVASFGALFVVAGKRSAELALPGEGGAAHRPVLASYPGPFLRALRLLGASVATTAYCLWGFERAGQLGRGHHPIWFELSIVPFVLALLVVELRFETGRGAAPEDLALGDRTLQILGLLWVALFVAGVYA